MAKNLTKTNTPLEKPEGNEILVEEGKVTKKTVKAVNETQGKLVDTGDIIIDGETETSKEATKMAEEGGVEDKNAVKSGRKANDEEPTEVHNIVLDKKDNTHKTIAELIKEKGTEKEITVEAPTLTKKQKSEGNVKVRFGKNYKGHIGGTNYSFRAGEVAIVPENVKNIMMKEEGLLLPL